MDSCEWVWTERPALRLSGGKVQINRSLRSFSCNKTTQRITESGSVGKRRWNLQTYKIESNSSFSFLPKKNLTSKLFPYFRGKNTWIVLSWKLQKEKKLFLFLFFVTDEEHYSRDQKFLSRVMLQRRNKNSQLRSFSCREQASGGPRREVPPEQSLIDAGSRRYEVQTTSSNISGTVWWWSVAMSQRWVWKLRKQLSTTGLGFIEKNVHKFKQR